MAFRYVDRTPGGLHTLDLVGHSYAFGSGARKDDYGFARKLARMLRCQRIKPYAIPGAIACWPTANGAGDGGYGHVLQQMTRRTFGEPYLPNSQVVAVSIGANDLAQLGSTRLRPFEEAFRTILARICAAGVEEDSNLGVMAYGGTNANVNISTNNSGSSIRSLANGATATLTLPGDFPGGVADMFFAASSFGAAQANFLVDGGAAGSLVTTGATICDTAKNNNAVKRFTGLAPGGHAIVATAAVTADALYFDHAAVEADPLDGPLILVFMPVRCPDYGLWTSFPHGPAAGTDPMNDAGVVALRAAIAAIAAEFGARVILVDADSVFAKQTRYFGADHGHPNDLGHAVLAQMAFDALRNSPLLTSRLSTRPAVDPRPYFIRVGGPGQGQGGIPGFSNNWTNFAGARPAGFYKDPSGEVFVDAAVASAVGASATQSIFTLPAGYRPAFNVDVPCTTWNGAAFSTATVRFAPDGSIVGQAGVQIQLLELHARFQAEA